MRDRHDRSSLLSSVVMVALATVATALLAFVGLQALPDNAVPFERVGKDRKPPTVIDVTGTPTPKATVSPPSSESPPTSTGTTGSSTSTSRPRTTRTVAPATTAPSAATATPKPTATAPKPAPTPSPSPTCKRGHSSRCPTPAASPSGIQPVPANPAQGQRTQSMQAPSSKGHGRNSR